MKKMNWENVGILVVTVVLNKLLLFGLIGSTERILTFGFLVLVILNFIVLAKSIDKAMQKLQNVKKKGIEMLAR